MVACAPQRGELAQQLLSGHYLATDTIAAAATLSHSATFAVIVAAACGKTKPPPTLFLGVLGRQDVNHRLRLQRHLG